MVTDVKLCIARKCKGLNPNYVQSMTKFIESLDSSMELVDSTEGYAAMYYVNGVSAPKKTTRPKKILIRAATVNAWTGAPVIGESPTVSTVSTPTASAIEDPLLAEARNLIAILKKPKSGGGAAKSDIVKPIANQSSEVFKISDDQLPLETSNNSRPKLDGFAVVISLDDRIDLIEKLRKFKADGILGEDALTREINMLTNISTRRTTREVLPGSFKDMPTPGTKIQFKVGAYACNDQHACLIVNIKNNNKRIVSGKAFMAADVAVGDNGNASKMLSGSDYSKYLFTPFTMTGTVALVIRNPDNTRKFVYNVQDIAGIMWDLLAGSE
jgi:hypothetical protein